MEPPIRNKPPIWNTFAADLVIFRIGVFTVLQSRRSGTKSELKFLKTFWNQEPRPLKKAVTFWSRGVPTFNLISFLKNIYQCCRKNKTI